jgi:hypothetical protein
VKTATILAAVLLASSSYAEEYGVLVTLTGETPVVVPFLRCERTKHEPSTETTPPVCLQRERDPRATFAVAGVRVTNLGDTLAWVHVGEDKVPVLPKTVFNLWAPLNARISRLFLSANPEETARVHVFATDPIQHERPPEVIKTEKAR